MWNRSRKVSRFRREEGPSEWKHPLKDITAIIAAIVASCSLTFAITTGSFAARLSNCRGQSGDLRNYSCGNKS